MALVPLWVTFGSDSFPIRFTTPVPEPDRHSHCQLTLRHSRRSPEGAVLAAVRKRRDRRANAPKGRDDAKRRRERECSR